MPSEGAACFFCGNARVHHGRGGRLKAGRMPRRGAAAVVGNPPPHPTAERISACTQCYPIPPHETGTRMVLPHSAPKRVSAAEPAHRRHAELSTRRCRGD